MCCLRVGIHPGAPTSISLVQYSPVWYNYLWEESRWELQGTGFHWSAPSCSIAGCPRTSSPVPGCWTGCTPDRIGSWRLSRPWLAQARAPCWPSGSRKAPSPVPGSRWIKRITIWPSFFATSPALSRQYPRGAWRYHLASPMYWEGGPGRMGDYTMVHEHPTWVWQKRRYL